MEKCKRDFFTVALLRSRNSSTSLFDIPCSLLIISPAVIFNIEYRTRNNECRSKRGIFRCALSLRIVASARRPGGGVNLENWCCVKLRLHLNLFSPLFNSYSNNKFTGNVIRVSISILFY